MFRRLLLTTVAAATAGSALAADLPYGQDPNAYAQPVPIFTWSGLYLGGQIGYGFGTSAISAWSPGYSISGVSYNPNGVLGGAHVGYNLQFNQIVLGVEGDVDGTGVSRSYGFGPVTYQTRIPVEGTIRGRLGFALDRALLYVVGGVAFASVTNNYQSFLGYDSIGKSVAGWTIGGGVEYALTNNWSVRAEYRYINFGSSTDYTFTAGPGAGVNHTLTTNDVRVGFSYKFDGLFPPPAGLTR